MSQNAQATARSYDWDRSYALFESAVERALAERPVTA
jgi:hypothetical protein